MYDVYNLGETMESLMKALSPRQNCPADPHFVQGPAFGAGPGVDTKRSPQDESKIGLDLHHENRASWFIGIQKKVYGWYVFFCGTFHGMLVGLSDFPFELCGASSFSSSFRPESKTMNPRP